MYFEPLKKTEVWIHTFFDLQMYKQSVWYLKEDMIKLVAALACEVTWRENFLNRARKFLTNE